MKNLLAMIALAATVAVAGAAQAAEHEILMLNRGDKGAMVFQPDFVRAAPGDTIKFIATDPGHNAELIAGMFPEGAATFRGKINEEITYTLEVEGAYGIKCAPHYGMGMVALIVVGDGDNLAAAEAVRHPGRAKTAFAELFGQAVAAR